MFGVLLLWLNLALAGAFNLTGTWELDLKASDKIDKVLGLAGGNWLEKTAANNMSVTQIIAQSESQLEVGVISSLNTQKESFPIDNQPHEGKDKDGKPVTHKTFWSADGSALITESTGKTKDGKAFTLSIQRTVADQGKTMVQALEIKLETGESAQANRIFRLKPPAP